MKNVIRQDVYFTPIEISRRWKWHPESVRRAIRCGRITSIVIGRRRLVPIAEVERIEAAGLIQAKFTNLKGITASTRVGSLSENSKQ